MKRSPTALFALILIAAACVAALSAAWIAVQLPHRTTQAFGSPADTLGAVQRLALSAQLITRQRSLLSPHDPAAGLQAFSIRHGESVADITNRLQQEGLVGDAELLRTFLVYSGLDTTIQAGEYRLSAAMSPVEIARELQDATPTDVDFTILAGWRLEEIAMAMPTSGLSFSPEQFLRFAVHPPMSLPLMSEVGPGVSLEGYLLAGSYNIPRDATLEEFAGVVLETLAAHLDSDVSNGMRPAFEQSGLSLHQAITLASMIEREAILEEEMPMVASVFHNRLAAGMRMDSDPTVQYALGFDVNSGTWWKNPLSLADLQIDSPFNTYRVSGLPLGPIAAPGIAALQAAAFPVQTPYYYFRAACDGSGRHVFAETYEQHQANACP